MSKKQTKLVHYRAHRRVAKRGINQNCVEMHGKLQLESSAPWEGTVGPDED